MPTTSSVCEAPWCTWEASGMRSRTIRFASAASDARRTLIPFASRASMVLFTRTSSAKVPHRRLSDPSVSTSSSLIIRNLLPRTSYTWTCNYCTLLRLHMQVPSEPDAAALFNRMVAREMPGRRGLQAWSALLRAHATLLRQLETDLESQTGLALADFDVLAQLAIGGGSLRMTELADRGLISRCGLTRRVTRLCRGRLVRRAHADGDAGGGGVPLTASGLEWPASAAAVANTGCA